MTPRVDENEQGDFKTWLMCVLLWDASYTFDKGSWRWFRVIVYYVLKTQVLITKVDGDHE